MVTNMNLPIRHILVDLETLGTHANNSVILSCAAIVFSFEEFKTFDDLVPKAIEVKFSVAEQVQIYNRILEPETVEFWKKQDEHLKKRYITPSKQDVGLIEGLEKIADYAYLNSYSPKNSYIWSRGIAFDIPKFENMFLDREKRTGKKCPFNFWKARDSRTFIDILTGSTDGKYEVTYNSKTEFEKHNSLHDCCMEVARMLEIYKNVFQPPNNYEDDIPF